MITCDFTCFHMLSCLIMSCHVLSCLIMSCHVLPWVFTCYHVITCDFLPFCTSFCFQFRKSKIIEFQTAIISQNAFPWMWLFSHHTQPLNVAFQPPHSTLECGCSATTHNHLMWLFSHHTQPLSVAVQPPLMHFFSLSFFHSSSCLVL